MNMNQFITVKLLAIYLLCCKTVFCEDKESISVAQDSTPQKYIEDNEIVKEKDTSTPTNEEVNKTRESRIKTKKKLVCPEDDFLVNFFALRCQITKDCKRRGSNNICCKNRCLQGVPPPLEEPVHSPALFGLIERVCPRDLIPEILEIKECMADTDCTPRICCPEKLPNGELIGYCRTPEAKLDNVPVARPFMEPIKTILSYMQCTPPPPPFLDLFPKSCNNPLDCFPNLCCQEKGKKFCRPPKRSLLTLLTTVAERIVPSETARDLLLKIAS